MAPAAKAATPATVTLKHLAAKLAEQHELSKKAAEGILADQISLRRHVACASSRETIRSWLQFPRRLQHTLNLSEVASARPVGSACQRASLR